MNMTVMPNVGALLIIIIMLALHPLAASAHSSCEDNLMRTLAVDLPVKRKKLRYWGEFQVSNVDYRAYRFAPEQVQELKVFIQNGLLVDGHGSLLNPHFMQNFVIDDQGFMYVFPMTRTEQGWLRHSSLVVPVVFAGTIGVRSGRVVMLTNVSGHYRFNGERLKKVAEALRRAGLSLAPESVMDFSRGFNYQAMFRSSTVSL